MLIELKTTLYSPERPLAAAISNSIFLLFLFVVTLFRFAVNCNFPREDSNFIRGKSMIRCSKLLFFFYFYFAVVSSCFYFLFHFCWCETNNNCFYNGAPVVSLSPTGGVTNCRVATLNRINLIEVTLANTERECIAVLGIVCKGGWGSFLQSVYHPHLFVLRLCLIPDVE